MSSWARSAMRRWSLRETPAGNLAQQERRPAVDRAIAVGPFREHSGKAGVSKAMALRLGEPHFHTTRVTRQKSNLPCDTGRKPKVKRERDANPPFLQAGLSKARGYLSVKKYVGPFTAPCPHPCLRWVLRNQLPRGELRA